ncbi:MAG: hypothetical protein LBP59_07170 [Planctomycetaceae bacterium]|jgi:hypothetical protein|nr:hypothetical protein [Planctomycetaceae bacterium]
MATISTIGIFGLFEKIGRSGTFGRICQDVRFGKLRRSRMIGNFLDTLRLNCDFTL